MQNEDCLCEARNVNNAERSGGIAHPNLVDASAYGFHRLPVVRIKPSLDLVQLEARTPARAARKPPQRTKRVAKKLDWLHLGII